MADNPVAPAIALDRFLCVTIANFPLEGIASAADGIFRRIRPERTVKTSAPLNIYSVYESAPPAGGAHLYEVILYAPKSSPNVCVVLSNLQDGWNSVCGLIARKHGQFQIQAKSSEAGTEYPQNYMEVWNNGQSTRVVYSMKDERGWQFFSRGHAESFESDDMYARRLKRERLTRGILVEYLGRLGWDITNPAFWLSDYDAMYYDETRKRKSHI